LRGKGGCGGTNGGEGAQIELDDGDAGRRDRLLDLGDGRLGRGARTRREEDGGGPVTCKLLDGLCTEARVAWTLLTISTTGGWFVLGRAQVSYLR